MTANAISNDERFIRLHEVLDMTGLSRSSLYSMVSEGKFPEPVGIGGKSKAWLLSETTAWMQERIKRSRE
ncbi:MAG: AlpA family transcriptional regulator [Pseudomonadota bacterium]